MDSPSAQPDPTLDDSVGAPRQPRQPLAQPPAQPTLPVVADTAEPDETTQVRDSMRSLIDPNHPFYQLRLDSEPIDPNSKITGKPLTICEMLESVSSPQTRCQLLHAYWALAGEIAKYKIAMFRQVQLSKWVREIGSTDAKLPIFQAAEKQAIAQCQSLELRVILKQNELASLLKQTGYYKPVVQANQAGAEPLPIPDDLPFVKVYTTHVNQLAQYRPASNLILLDKTITLRKQIFESKFQEFAASEELFNAIQDASLKSQASVESLILAHSQYLAAYGECTDAIIEYNDSIADYVAQTVGPEITGRRLLATLIHLNPEPADNPADSVPVVE